MGGRTGTTTQAHIDQFELGPNGEVDILIAPADKMPDPRPRNSIVLLPGTGQVAVRETFFDRSHDTPSDLRIELVDDVPPPVLGVEEIASKIEFAGLFVQFVAATAMSMWARHGLEHQHVRRHGRVRSRGGSGGRGPVAQQPRDDLPRWPLGPRRRRGARRHGARPAERVPLLGAHDHDGVDGEPRLPVHDDQPEQPHGASVLQTATGGS